VTVAGEKESGAKRLSTKPRGFSYSKWTSRMSRASKRGNDEGEEEPIDNAEKRKEIPQSAREGDLSGARGKKTRSVDRGGEKKGEW